MPAHNESENLRWMLPHVNEVLPRMFERFDVIIVDDGSTDGTGDVAKSVAKELGMDPLPLQSANNDEALQASPHSA